MSALLVFAFNLNDLFVVLFNSNYQWTLGYIATFLIFYFMASGFVKKWEAGHLFGAILMAFIYFSVGAWLPLVAIVCWAEIGQIEAPGAEYYACAIASTVLSPIILLYYPVKDIVKGINAFKNKND